MDQGDERIQRMLDSIEALGTSGDAVERLKRLTKVLNQWPELHRQVRAMRQEAAKELHDDGMPYDAIGKLIDVTESRARHIVKGITNPAKQKATVKKDDAENS